MDSAALTDQSKQSINMLPVSILHSIFHFLGPKDLCMASSTCTLWRNLNKDAAANKIWKGFYSLRWKIHDHSLSLCWHKQYSTKVQQLKLWQGKLDVDTLYGHKLGVKCVQLLPANNVVVTGSYDKTLRLWDLQNGMPISVSSPHKGTVRCLAIDSSVLVSGSMETNMRVWLAKSAEAVSSGSPLFDLPRPSFRLTEHTGPVSSLSLTERCLYSGGWDYTVRIWDRATWSVASVLSYDDFVSCVVARGPHLLVAAGEEVLVHDAATCQLLRRFQNLHAGQVTALEACRTGRTFYTGGQDGLVLAHDMRVREGSRVLWHYRGGVNGLAMEDPWLACASENGVVVIKTDAPGTGTTREYGKFEKPNSRTLPKMCGGSVTSVDIVDNWAVAGLDTGVVRVWSCERGGRIERVQRTSGKKTRQQRRNRVPVVTGQPHCIEHAQSEPVVVIVTPQVPGTFLQPEELAPVGSCPAIAEHNGAVVANGSSHEDVTIEAGIIGSEAVRTPEPSPCMERHNRPRSSRSAALSDIASVHCATVCSSKASSARTTSKRGSHAAYRPAGIVAIQAVDPRNEPSSRGFAYVDHSRRQPSSRRLGPSTPPPPQPPGKMCVARAGCEVAFKAGCNESQHLACFTDETRASGKCDIAPIVDAGHSARMKVSAANDCGELRGPDPDVLNAGADDVSKIRVRLQSLGAKATDEAGSAGRSHIHSTSSPQESRLAADSQVFRSSTAKDSRSAVEESGVQVLQTGAMEVSRTPAPPLMPPAGGTAEGLQHSVPHMTVWSVRCRPNSSPNPSEQSSPIKAPSS